MKYIKRLNIDFNDWDKIETTNKFLLFNSGNYYYLGYIYKNADTYQISLLKNLENFNININVIKNIKFNISSSKLIHYSLNDVILFGKINKDKIIIVGKDYDSQYIKDNPDKFVMNKINYDIRDIMIGRKKIY